MTQQQIQDLLDYGAMTILVLASVGCIKLGKKVYRIAPVCYRIYKWYVIAIDIIVLAFAFLYKYPLK